VTSTSRSQNGSLRDKIGKVKAITLDLGWTLAYPSPGLWETFATLCQEAGHSLTAEVCEAAAGELAIAAQQAAVAKFDGQRKFSDSDEKFRAGFQMLSMHVFSSAGMEDNDGEHFRRFFRTFNNFERWKVYPDVGPFLKGAREAGIRVGLISNAGSALKEHIRILGLDRFFDTATVSAIEGVRKPDRRVFERTLERLSVGAEEALHVGDFYLEDVLGPRQIGLTGILIDRHPNSLFPSFPQQDHHADPELHVIRSLEEIAFIYS